MSEPEHVVFNRVVDSGEGEKGDNLPKKDEPRSYVPKPADVSIKVPKRISKLWWLVVPAILIAVIFWWVAAGSLLIGVR